MAAVSLLPRGHRSAARLRFHDLRATLPPPGDAIADRHQDTGGASPAGDEMDEPGDRLIHRALQWLIRKKPFYFSPSTSHGRYSHSSREWPLRDNMGGGGRMTPRDVKWLPQKDRSLVAHPLLCDLQFNTEPSTVWSSLCCSASQTLKHKEPPRLLMENLRVGNVTSC